MHLEVEIEIEDEEWDSFSHENKLLLLSRMKKANSALTQALIPFFSSEIALDENKKTIDIEATLRQLGDE